MLSPPNSNNNDMTRCTKALDVDATSYKCNIVLLVERDKFELKQTFSNMYHEN